MFFRCFFCTVRLSIFERFVFPKGSKFNRLVWDSLEIWKCGLYIDSLHNRRQYSQQVTPHQTRIQTSIPFQKSGTKIRPMVRCRGL